MATTIVPGTGIAPTITAHEFSLMERMMLRRVHPVSIICDIIGMMWSVYFLWNHNWPAALAVVLCARAVAIAATWNLDFKAMAETVWGKIALLHLVPFNLAIQLAGGVVWVWGLWQHSTDLIMVGLSLIVAGHAFGWSKVHRSLVQGRS